MYFSLKTSYSRFIDIELTANSTIPQPEQSSFNTRISKAHCDILVLRNTRQHFSTMPGVILNSKVTKKRHTNKKKQALSGPQKGSWFIVWEQKQEGRAPPCLILSHTLAICYIQILNTVLQHYSVFHSVDSVVRLGSNPDISLD